jgi:membrane fusion protein, copper/silver efflux system
MLPNQVLKALHQRPEFTMLRCQGGFIAWLLVLLIAMGGALGVGYMYRDMLGETKLGQLLHLKTESPSKDIYYCPMHPQIQSDKPGTCPICNMNLEIKAPDKGAASKQTSAGQTKAKDLYYCPMHPQIQSDKPGTCPICNMDLVKKQPEETPAMETRSSGKVRINPEMQQLIGVEYGEVTEQQLSRSLMTVGRLAYDETKIARIQTKIEGWIEKTFVDFSGMQVKKGQPLISVYSPELFSAQQELIIAKQTMDALAGSEFSEIRGNAESLYAATKERLRLWNISEGEVKQIEKRGAPAQALTFYSPMDGFVINRNAFPGQRIAPDTELYTIVDLSTIWVLADVFEYEIPRIQLGQSATMELSYFPGETFKGVISYIYPVLDNTSRTLKVRLQFPNPGFKLKPDMWANVTLKIDYGVQLSVPASAVLDSGIEQMVFVAFGDGYFEPRKIQLGAQVDKRYIVLSGLKHGEKIVTSGNFLIDSESKLKSTFSGVGNQEHAGHGGTASGGGQQGQDPAQPKGTSGGQFDHSGHK